VAFAHVYIQPYAASRIYSWDTRKTEANLAERGFDKERIAHEAAIEAKDPESWPCGR
jgi:hypothetical protein